MHKKPKSVVDFVASDEDEGLVKMKPVRKSTKTKKKSVFDFVAEDEPVLKQKQTKNKKKPVSAKKPRKRKIKLSRSRKRLPAKPDNKVLAASLKKFLTGDVNFWHKFRGRDTFTIPWIAYLYADADKKHICIPHSIPYANLHNVLYAAKVDERKAQFISRPIDTNEHRYWPRLSALPRITDTSTIITLSSGSQKTITHKSTEEIVFVPAFAGARAGKFHAANIMTEINKCEKMKGVRWSLYFLRINVSATLAHANILIFDHKNKVLQRFEPHGATGENKLMAQVDKTLLDLTRIQKSIPEMSYKPMAAICIGLGPQKIELQSLIAKNTEEVFGVPVNMAPAGLCAVWSLLFVHFRLTYFKLSNEDIVARMLGDPDVLASEIRRYASAIVVLLEENARASTS